MVLLINEATSPFFNPKRSLRQGFPLSHLNFFFSLVVEAFNISLKDVKRRKLFYGMKVVNNGFLTLLFVYDIITFSNDALKELKTLK